MVVQLSAISPNGGCLRLLLLQAQSLRAEACLIFQQRCKESNQADFAEHMANSSACVKPTTHFAAVATSLSVIPEDANEVPDCIGEFPDDEVNADERISAALEVLLDRAVSVAQESAAVVDEKPNAPTPGASTVSNCKLKAKSSSAPNLGGASFMNQVVARHAPSPMPPSKWQRLETVPRVLGKRCTVQGHSRIQHKPVCRVIKQPDTSCAMPPSKMQRLEMVPSLLGTTCTVQGQSRFHHKPVCRIIKQPDTSWIRSDWRQPLLRCSAWQVSPAGQDTPRPHLLHRVGSWAPSTFAESRTHFPHLLHRVGSCAPSTFAESRTFANMRT